jgi:hypothetical protein
MRYENGMRVVLYSNSGAILHSGVVAQHHIRGAFQLEGPGASAWWRDREDRQPDRITSEILE